MKKLFRLICLAAILCVAYLALTTPRGNVQPAMKTIGGETNEVIGDAVRQADEAIGDAVKRADQALDSAVEQADKALADAVDSAAEGAKQGFMESLKESASEFWNKIFSQKKE